MANSVGRKSMCTLHLVSCRFFAHSCLCLARILEWASFTAPTSTGQKLQRCLDIIHGDIVSIWNIKDPSDVSSISYQITSFKSESRHYSTWRVTVSRRESPVLLLTWLQTRGHQCRCNSCPPLQYISLGHQFGRYHVNFNGGHTCHGCCIPPEYCHYMCWVSGHICEVGIRASIKTCMCHNFLSPKRQMVNVALSPDNIACIMAYIVDLTIVMHWLFTVTVDVTEEHVVSVLKGYVKGFAQRNLGKSIMIFAHPRGRAACSTWARTKCWKKSSAWLKNIVLNQNEVIAVSFRFIWHLFVECGLLFHITVISALFSILTNSRYWSYPTLSTYKSKISQIKK